MSTAPHDKLARWLDESSAGAPEPAPEGLAPDVVEAVYALRPDLAPPPRVDIDDILAELTEGPLAPSPDARAAEARAAAAFAALLDDDSADLGGDDLDSDAVETLMALRPERAPAPQLDIDDIFAAVSEGPFAQPDNVVTLPTATATATATPAADAGEAPAAEVVEMTPRRSRRTWWALPGLGALAAAAAALMVVQPLSLNEAAPVDMALDEARYTPSATSAPAASAAPAAPAAPDPVSDKSRVSANASAPAGGADLGARAEQKPASEETFADELTAAPSEDPAPADVPMPEPMPEPEPEPVPEPAAKPVEAAAAPPQQGAEAYAAGPVMGGVAATATLEAEEVASGDANAQLSALGYVGAEEAEGGLADDAYAFGMADDEDMDVADVRASAGEVQRDETVSAPAGRGLEWSRPGRRSNGLFSGSDRAAGAPAAAPQPEMDVVSEDLGELEERNRAARADSPLTMMTLRTRAARSFESVPSVAAGHPELASAYAEVDALVAAGQLAEAVDRLDGLRRSADPDVALDVAWRRCDLLLRRGLVVPAIAALDEGLQSVGGDPRLRARALYQKGQLLERRGDVAGATAAYQEAARLR